MKELNDLSLVTRVAVLHDRRAFDTLVRKYQSPVRRFFLHQTLGDEQLSDDLAQDTFVKAYTHITAFRGLSGFSTWLFRIAYNVFYDYMRSRHQQADLSLVEAADKYAELEKEKATLEAEIARLREVHSQKLSKEAQKLMKMPFQRAITKKEQADMGKLKKSVRGLVVVHPMTALGREMGLEEMTGFSKTAF